MKWLPAAALCAALLVGCSSTAERTTTATEPPTTAAPTTTEPAPTTSTTAAPALAASTAATGPGSPAVYQQIATIPTCGEAQAAFDRFELNHGYAINRKNIELAKVLTTYMAAADARMKELHC